VKAVSFLVLLVAATLCVSMPDGRTFAAEGGDVAASPPGCQQLVPEDGAAPDDCAAGGEQPGAPAPAPVETAPPSPEEVAEQRMSSMIPVLLAIIGPRVMIERSAPRLVTVGTGEVRATADSGCARWVWDGRWTCPDDVWRIRLGDVDTSTLIGQMVLEHELAHVLDWMDDGMANGSPGHPRPGTFEEALALTGGRPPWEPTDWYCWAAGVDAHGTLLAPATDANRAEWYACEVVRTGNLQ